MSVNVRAGVEIEGKTSGFKAAMQDATGSLKGLEAQVARTGDAIKRVGHYGAGLYALKQAFEFGRGIADTADQMSTLASRIKLVTGSGEEQLRIQSRLFDVAQASRVSYTELGGTYAQIARSTSQLGLSHERLLGVVESISQAMTIGGGSAQSMQAALVQLSQGLASGTLRGEELNSILEQTPRLAQAIANGMGVSIGKLRELGGEGKLTAQQIVGALESQAGALKAEFDQVQKTIGGSVTQVGNATMLLVGNLNQVSGAGAAVSSALGSVADGLTALAKSNGGLEMLTHGMKALATAGAAYVAVNLVQFLAGKAVALKAVVVETIAYVAALQAQRAAAAAAATAEAGLAAARGAAAGGALAAARGASMLVPGLNAVVAALSLGATAWMLWGNSAKDGEAKAKGEVRKSTDEVIADLDKQIAKLRERNELARLAKKGGVEPADPMAEAVGSALRDYQDAVAGRGRFANVQGAARESAIKALGGKYAELTVKAREFKAEQDAVTLASGLAGDGDKASAWMVKYASRAEKMNAELKKARDENALTPELEARIRKTFAEPGADKPGKDSARIYKQISEEIAAQQVLADQALAQGRALTQVEADRLKLLQEIGENEGQLGKGRAATLRARVEDLSVSRQQVEHQRELAAIAEQTYQERQRASQAAMQQAEARQQENVALRAEVEQIGLNAAELYRLEQQRLADALATKEQRYERLMAGQATTMETEALRIEIEALKERRELLQKGRGRTIDKELADASAEQRKRDADDAKRREEMLAESISNGILEGTRDGMSMMKVFRDELKAQFAKTVLRPVISPMVSAMNKGVELLMNAAVGMVSGALGGGGFGTGAAYGNQDIGQFLHGGGRVGYDAPAATRMMPASTWAGAPRLHSGRLAPDEYPAILQRGESVLTSGQMGQLAPAGQQSVQVTLINQSGTPLEASAQQKPGGGIEVLLTAVKEAIAGDIGSGSGAIPRALQGRYGLRPSFSSM